LTVGHACQRIQQRLAQWGVLRLEIEERNRHKPPIVLVRAPSAQFTGIIVASRASGRP
jgi:hypothetical protein